MDERVLPIVKAMAMGHICYDDCSGMCLYCEAMDYDENYSPIPEPVSDLYHKPGCPVTLARTLLKEQGTPVNVYRIDFEYSDNPNRKTAKWIPGKNHALALTPEGATSEYTSERFRNVQATLMREVPLQGVGRQE